MRRPFTTLLAAIMLQTTWVPAAMADFDPYRLPLSDKTLTPQELALQRYKLQRLTVKVQGESWEVVQGINVTVPDEQLLQLSGQTSKLKEQKQKDLIGGVITVAGGLMGIFGVLVLAKVVPTDETMRLGLGFGTLGVGIVTAATGELLFPMALPGDHALTVDEARTCVAIINARLKTDLGLPPDMQD